MEHIKLFHRKQDLKGLEEGKIREKFSLDQNGIPTPYVPGFSKNCSHLHIHSVMYFLYYFNWKSHQSIQPYHTLLVSKPTSTHFLSNFLFAFRCFCTTIIIFVSSTRSPVSSYIGKKWISCFQRCIWMQKMFVAHDNGTYFYLNRPCFVSCFLFNEKYSDFKTVWVIWKSWMIYDCQFHYRKFQSKIYKQSSIVQSIARHSEYMQQINSN